MHNYFERKRTLLELDYLTNKCISFVDNTCVNVVRLTTSDDEELELESVPIGNELYGIELRRVEL